MTEDTVSKIYSNLKLLTQKNQIAWENVGGTFWATYENTDYKICLLGFLLNNIPVAGPSENTMDFYDFIAEQTVINSTLQSLDEACNKFF